MEHSRQLLMMHAIHEDALFIGDYLSSLQRPEAQGFMPFLSFCMGSYMALFVYEGQRQIKKIDPDLGVEISDAAQQVLTRSRHSLKLFDDSKLGLEGLQSLFWDEIVPSHEDYFVGLLRFSWLKPLAKDVGVYRYNGRVISTTHAASFSLGLEASAIVEANLGERILSISTEYGRYFGALGAALDMSAVSFPDYLDGALFSQREEDYQAKKYYRTIFNGTETPELNATLLLLLGHLNFINEIVSTEPDSARLRYSTFKIRFLGIYQIVRSLVILRDQQHERLTAESLQAIDLIAQHPGARALMADDMRPLRNTLMHYSVDSRLDPTQLNTDNLLGTLLAAALGEERVEDFFGDFDALISETAALMNSWLQGRWT
ncbi:hypothetical protein ACFSWE_07000 [Leucobacter albus]|uniref:Uncharacterized protein n=1 Tax=Leucobacter albus TaxID=272210 RepID=A0ABW3TJ82_9MICO